MSPVQDPQAESAVNKGSMTTAAKFDENDATIINEEGASSTLQGKGKWNFSKRTWVFLALSVLVLVGVGLAITFAPRASNGGSAADGNVPDDEGEAVTQARFVEFRTVLASYSDPTKFADPDTPQSKALNWLVYKDKTVASEGDVDHLLQRYAIMVLFYACSGEDWRGFVTPLDEQPEIHECSFFGIECDDTMAIVSLDLLFQRLVGPIPEEIGLLSRLTSLDLSENFLEGAIPDAIYTKLTDLENLSLGSNELMYTISPKIANLHRLKRLNLATNYLTASLPAEMALLTNLHTLDVSTNDLTGQVLDFIVDWPHLEDLTISANKFTGTIPEAIGDSVPNLRSFTALDTRLSGPYPPSFTKLADLEHMVIHSSEFSGTIPDDIWKLSNLESIYFERTSGKGTIPTTIGLLPKLGSLVIAFTQMSGPLPTELGALKGLYELYLESNLFSGTVPSEIASLPDLDDAWFQYNRITGDIDHLCHIPEIHFSCDLICNCCGKTCSDCGNTNGNCNSESWQKEHGPIHNITDGASNNDGGN